MKICSLYNHPRYSKQRSTHGINSFGEFESLRDRQISSRFEIYQMQRKVIHRKDSKEMFSSVEFSLSKPNMLPLRLAAGSCSCKLTAVPNKW